MRNFSKAIALVAQLVRLVNSVLTIMRFFQNL
jgi:hypothetical protein